jgi:peptidoglycan hydrolase CwlO-like protein
VAELESIPALLKAKEKELVKATQEKTKLSSQIEKLEASVGSWKSKLGEVQAQLEFAKGEKDKEGNVS